MKCPKCNHENPATAKFCMECGTKLERKCPKCGTGYPVEALFCMKCGTRLAEEETVSSVAAVSNLEDMQDRLYIPEPLRKRMDSAMQEMEGENRSKYS